MIVGCLEDREIMYTLASNNPDGPDHERHDGALHTRGFCGDGIF